MLTDTPGVEASFLSGDTHSTSERERKREREVGTEKSEKWNPQKAEQTMNVARPPQDIK